MPEEEWRPIEGFEGRYDVSDQGRIRSHLRKNFPNHIRHSFPNHAGYWSVVLKKADKTTKHMHVHVLVARAFHGPCPEGWVARHLNGDQNDNSAENLRWGTYSENAHDTVRHGRHNKANVTHCPKGHPYDEENTEINKAGSRECVICRRHNVKMRVRRYRARQKVMA